MASIFIGGDEIANQKDLNRLLGQNDYVSDSLDNHISALEKQIGGVLSSALNHLKHRLAVA